MTPDQHARLREFARRTIYAAFDSALDNSEVIGWAEELSLVETKVATESDIADAIEDDRVIDFKAGDEIDVIVDWLASADENDEVGA
jgi:hypothetical protein